MLCNPDVKKWKICIIFFTITLITIFSSTPAWTYSGDVVVVYPSVREPYALIYRQYLAGIKQAYRGNIIAFPVSSDYYNNQSIPSALPKGDHMAYVALGKRSLSLLANQSHSSPVFAILPSATMESPIAGGILLKPSAESQISVLKRFIPDTRTIHVVFNPIYHETLIRGARKYATENNISLNSNAVTDIRESAKRYRSILATANPYEAIWLLPDGGLIDASLLQLILNVAWDKKLAVYTSNPLFVKRGALFAIYPDNIGIGARLGEIISSYKEGAGSQSKLEFLQNFHIAYNERTGNHIGITLSPNVRETIELLLPEL